jgi:hypothetical protein
VTESYAAIKSLFDAELQELEKDTDSKQINADQIFAEAQGKGLLFLQTKIGQKKNSD